MVWYGTPVTPPIMTYGNGGRALLRSFVRTRFARPTAIRLTVSTAYSFLKATSIRPRSSEQGGNLSRNRFVSSLFEPPEEGRAPRRSTKSSKERY